MSSLIRRLASISPASSRRQLIAQGIPLTTFLSSSEMDFPNVKIGMLFAFKSRRRDSLSWRVWVWLRESDFAIMGMMLVSVDKCRMIVMSTGFRPYVRLS